MGLLITNGRVLLPDSMLRDSDVLLADGLIQKIGAGLAGEARVDAGGGYVLPGLIDLHVHGLGFISNDTGSLEELARLEAARGCTTFFPTLFAPPAELAEQMRRHRRETDELKKLPQVGGFRLESPYLAYTGAGLSRDLAAVSADVTDALLDAGGGHIKIWDISPELPGAPGLIERLAAEGIVCSIAHTRANLAEARAGVDAGARLVTHLFDTFLVPEMTDPGVFPAGIIDYFLVEDRLACEIIADGTHAHPLLVEKALRCKSPERLAFVTDSNYGSGLPSGEYDLPSGWGRVAINGSNNGVRLIDREMGLAGSALTPLDAFRNAIVLFGLDLPTASQVCSRTPARLLGLNAGEIAAGKEADVIILDEELNLRATIVAGEIVYRA
ncbi:MAG: N-acetylglucosamine-6-phosphate deacetylase [Armatimonadota bacterium]